MKGNIWKRTI